MKYLSMFWAVFALIVLTGCDPTIRSTDVTTDAASLQRNAIIVTRVHAPYKGVLFGDGDIPIQSFWRRLDGAQGEQQTRYIIGREGLFAGLDTNGFHEHMVLPGKYRLEKLAYSTTAGKVTTHHTITVEPHMDVNFEVKPGDIVYIGDIQYKTTINSASIVDHYDEASKWFKEQHPEINKPLEKRLLTGMDPSKSLIYKVLMEGLKKVIEDEKKKNKK